jgi:gliding motility-associated-like protein
MPSILLDGLGNSTQNIPSCINPGFVIHNTVNVPAPVYNSGFTFIDSIQSNGFFVNNSDGSGSFGNPVFNSIYYLSPAADFSSNWGNFSCPTSTLENGVPIVFLSPLLVNSSYNNSTCTMTMSFSGGFADFSGQTIPFHIDNPFGQEIHSGTLNQGGIFSTIAAIAGTYTISVNDNYCPVVFTIDASGCSNPCSPVIVPIVVNICEGDSVFVAGDFQNTNGIYIDSSITFNGCDSVITTTLIVHENPTYSFQNFTVCEGESITVNGNTYNQNGQFQDTLVGFYGCDSILTTSLFVITPVVVNQQAYICHGESYLFNGIDYSNEGVYFDSTNTILGCDSINVLSLFIKEDYQTYLFDTICLGSNYYFAYDSLSNSGTYTWPLLSDNGCDSTIVLNLYVDNCDEITLYAPNSFTPDGDGLNDLWYPIIRNSKSLTYSIYNRWGEKILDSSELPWDGKYNGIDCPIGVYTYVINYTDNSNLANQINGYISLIR